MRTRWVCGRDLESGSTIVEVLLVAVLAMSLATMAVPLTAQVADVSRAHAAAAFLGARIRSARQQAVSGNRAVAVVFDRVGGAWVFRLCSDGNGNGVRRAEISTGGDSCGDGAYSLSGMFPGSEFGLLSGVPAIGEESGTETDDGVRFGRSGMASCSSLGNCSPGTLYLRSQRGHQWAIRVAGVTGRTRLLRFDPGLARWTSA